MHGVTRSNEPCGRSAKGTEEEFTRGQIARIWETMSQGQRSGMTLAGDSGVPRMNLAQ